MEYPERNTNYGLATLQERTRSLWSRHCGQAVIKIYRGALTVDNNEAIERRQNV
jgi:hypothetical protein